MTRLRGFCILACKKPKELGYAHELWTYSLLQEHVRKYCETAGHPSLTELSRSRLHRILTQGEIRPHKIVRDRHASAHISKETQSWLSLHPSRFEFVFTPKHGSWLNIVETMFSEMARSMLRGVRVASKQELIDRIHLYFEQINADPVIYRAKAILYLGVRDCGDSAMFIINSVADYPAILVKDGAARVNYFTDDRI